MFRNFFISAHRNIIGNKIQSAIQVTSLAIGFSAFILIGLYARFELNYDHYNEKFDRIYRLEYGTWVGMPVAIGHRIKTQLPEVENVVRIVNWHGKDNQIPYEMENERGEKETIWAEGWYFCDSSIFDVFTFDFIHGDPKRALRDPESRVISESLAHRLYGKRNPMGEQIGTGRVDGVFKDLQNSHIEMNILIPMVSMNNDANKRGNPDFLDNYAPDYSFINYVLLRPEAQPDMVTRRINELLNERTQESNSFLTDEKAFHLRPLGEVYFTNDSTNEKNYSRHGNRKLVFVLMTVAIFILVLAVINYVNLTTARISLRAKEAGIRKILGASRTMLIIQFLLEAIMVALFSLLIALTLTQLLLPAFNNLTGSGGGLQLYFHRRAYMIYVVLGIGLGILSGIYPAIQLTRFPAAISQAVQVKAGSRQVIFRRVLLTFQFSVSVILIVGVLVILKQLRYMKTADIGFDKEQVIYFDNPFFGHDQKNRLLLKERLTAHPDVLGIGYSNSIQGEEEYCANSTLLVNGIRQQLSIVAVNPDFFDVMGIEVVKGRNFSWDRSGDYLPNAGNQFTRVLINETAAKSFDMEEPVGYSQHFENGNGGFEIIGVVKDFNFASQHKKIEPTAFLWWDYLGIASVKISPRNIPETIRFIKEQVEAIIPDYVFRYTFLDELYERQYLRDEKTAIIISVFALTALLIACLGLFGLSSFMAVRRTKEIGIRKSLGASEKSVYLMLSREFARWVLFSIVIAAPLAWLVMNRWLHSFAYRTNISWWIFALAILVSVLITFATISWQSLKTAHTNPVNALRYE
ncbi:MAG: FtsX-like permease family protein [Bacteroidales bacterium]